MTKYMGSKSVLKESTMLSGGAGPAGSFSCPLYRIFKISLVVFTLFLGFICSILWLETNNYICIGCHIYAQNSQQETLTPNPKKELKNPALVLRNSTILFMGDSLTRYQYMSFVYRLEFGKWVAPHHFLCYAHMAGSWSNYFAKTTNLFRGKMMCDCARKSSSKDTIMFENRLYYNSKYNLSVWFVQWFGENLHPQGHVMPWDYRIVKDIPKDKCRPSNCDSTNDAWKLAPGQLMERFVRSLNPQFVIFNSGLHTNYSQISNSSTIGDLTSTMSRLNLEKTRTKFIWKSTTPSVITHTNGKYFLKYRDSVAETWKNSGQISIYHTSHIVEKLWNTFNNTEKATESIYLDRSHYKCWVYNHLNEGLFKYLNHLISSSSRSK